MKSLSSRLSRAVVAIALALALPAGATELSAEDVAKKNFVATKPTDSTAQIRVRLINASGQERVRDTEARTKLAAGSTDNMTYVRFLAPTDVRDTKTLVLEHSDGDDDIWIYLPAMKKVRRLVASNKKDSYVGTDFSYADVIGHKVLDWTYRFAKEERMGDRDCYVLEASPKAPQVAEDSGYSKRVLWVDKESFVALRTDLYDLNGALYKKITQEQVQKVDAAHNTYQPMRITAENVQTNHKTVLEFRDFKAGVGVGSEVFTARYLEQ